ncbi:hypothetical protein LCGC14_0551930 [marine sediment metagenome]|uniref:Uncharacterized protein n=1 Tax=marine sediment metagenome TaxID=412755 RepID=A0A0F9UB07_9ZZZZ
MAILDERSEFCDAVAVPTGGAATTLVGDVMDLGSVARDIGQGKPIYLNISVDTAIAGGTAVQFVLASDSTAAISTDGSETRHFLSDVFAVADLIAGFSFSIALPMGDVAASVTPYERYLGILVVGTGTQSAGAINAFLSVDPHGWRSYPDANN